MIARARTATGEAMKRAAWAWAGVPSGVLGWVSTRTVSPLTSGTRHARRARPPSGGHRLFPDTQKVLSEVFRVLRPGGRVVLNIGERVPPGTQTHRVWDTLWVWSEDDVRRMVDQAGFIDVTISYAASFGRDPVSRFLVWLWRRLGNDMSELRLVGAAKE